MTYDFDRHSLKSFDEAVQLADKASAETGKTYLGVDYGDSTYPRYSITEAPMVGDKVSRCINGDSYIDGEIVAVAKNFRYVTTSSGKKYYRRKNTASWKYAQSFILCKGHEEKRNPHI